MDFIPSDVQKKKYPWNVISENEFKTMMQDIFNLIYEPLKATAGPYGAITMLERRGEYHMTKDGFTVLKNIHFIGASANAVMDMIMTISHQMVMKVGDGSTTTIMVAKNFLDTMRDNPYFKSIRPKDFMDKSNAMIESLCQYITKSAHPVDDNNYVDVVRRTANIATNGDDTFTKYITDIYERAGKDVHISKRMSATTESGYELQENVYHINGKYLDQAYINTQNDTVEIDKPIVILFNYTLEDKHWNMLMMFMNFLNTIAPDSRVVFIAPYYDNFIGERIKAEYIRFKEFYKSKTHQQGGLIPYPMVFASAPFIRGVDHYIFDDLGPFLGSQVLNPVTTDEFNNKMQEYYKALQYEQEEDVKAEQEYQNAVMQAKANGIDDAKIMEIRKREIEQKSLDLYQEAMKLFNSFIGRCDAIKIGSKTIEFGGFPYKDEEMAEIHYNNAVAMLNKEFEMVENSRYVHKEYMYAMERLAHLSCKSAIIDVGGNSELEKSMNNDALDDAIKACESVVKHGYVYGNNTAVIKAINQYIADNANDIGEFDVQFLQALKDAFIRTILSIYQNKSPEYNYDEVKNILDESIHRDASFDLISEEYTNEIINSVRTDIEILKGSIAMVTMMVSANQYISIYVEEKNKDISTNQ